MRGAPRAPVEWIPGDSQHPWALALATVMSLSAVAAYWSILLGLSWAGSYVVSPRLTLVLQLASVAVGVGPGMLWVILVPMPAPRLGVSPEGVTVDHGLRSESWPWSRAFLRGGRLEVFSSRFGVPSRFALTPWQAHRAALLDPRAR